MFGKRKASSPRQDQAQDGHPGPAPAGNGTATSDAPLRRQAGRQAVPGGVSPQMPRDDQRRAQPAMAQPGAGAAASNPGPANGAGQIAARGAPQGGARSGDDSPVENDDVDASRKLVVGRGISLSGQIKTCEKLVVEGKVEANLTDCVTLVIADSGLFNGSARVQDAEISGCFEGDLVVLGRLFLRSSGILEGTIKYADLEIERGGKIAGTVDLIDDPATAAAELLIDDEEDEPEADAASAEPEAETVPEAVVAEQAQESAAQEARQGRLKIG